MSIEIFNSKNNTNSEQEYLDWLERNPGGYVVNLEQYSGNSTQGNSYSGMCIHHANGHTINSSGSNENFTVNSYQKICTSSLVEAEEEARKISGRDEIKHCTKCMTEKNISTKEKRSAKNAGDAGEYYIAYMLSRLGISAALTTSGTSAVDILATVNGVKSISIQVKSSWARSQPRQWMVGSKRPHVSDSLIYIFCNMFEDIDIDKAPEVFIVPSTDVDASSTWHHKAPLFKITPDTAPGYLNNWKLILNKLI
ncbi:hypothetical protein [Edwardsiella tarda]|uniref:hypothetical protein n=1 Tax=Edwardsiella TaxID=635 RepID=UPI00351C29F0